MPEPPIEIEPMTYALRETRSLPAHALAALIAQKIALTAITSGGMVAWRENRGLVRAAAGWGCCRVMAGFWAAGGVAGVGQWGRAARDAGALWDTNP